MRTAVCGFLTWDFSTVLSFPCWSVGMVGLPGQCRLLRTHHCTAAVKGHSLDLVTGDAHTDWYCQWKWQSQWQDEWGRPPSLVTWGRSCDEGKHIPFCLGCGKDQSYPKLSSYFWVVLRLFSCAWENLKGLIGRLWTAWTLIGLPQWHVASLAEDGRVMGLSCLITSSVQSFVYCQAV